MGYPRRRDHQPDTHREGRPIREQVAATCDLIDGPVSDSNVVVKCPLTRDGIEACAALTKEGIRVNVTPCFSPGQAPIAARTGAYFISPLVGRIDDEYGTGMDLVRQIVAIYRNNEFHTRIPAASPRGPTHAIESALPGAHIGTTPFR